MEGIPHPRSAPHHSGLFPLAQHLRVAWAVSHWAAGGHTGGVWPCFCPGVPWAFSFLPSWLGPKQWPPSQAQASPGSTPWEASHHSETGAPQIGYGHGFCFLPRIPYSVQLGSSEDRVKGTTQAHLSLPIPFLPLAGSGTEGARLVFLHGWQQGAQGRWLSLPDGSQPSPPPAHTHTPLHLTQTQTSGTSQ